MLNKKLAIVVSHPIQYYASLFREVAKEIPLVVFYGDNPSSDNVGKSGFGIPIKWDIDMFSDYNYEFYNNINEKNSDLTTYNSVAVKDIEEHFKKHQITHCIIFGWYLKYYIQALKYCNKNKICVAVRGDSQINPNGSKLKHFIKKLSYPFLLKKYNSLFYVGIHNKEYLLTYGAKEKQLIFSPHAVDQNFWTPKVQKEKNQDKIIFLWVGKFINIKRPLDMVEAFNNVSQNHNNIELWMVGSGNLFNRVEAKSKTNKKIQLLGFKNQSELKEVYSKADCLVLTSESESWGLVVNEAFCFNIPVILSDTCGCSSDLIIENETGYIYKKGSISELSKKMIHFIKDFKSSKNFNSAISEKNKIYSYSEIVQSFKTFMQ